MLRRLGISQTIRKSASEIDNCEEQLLSAVYRPTVHRQVFSGALLHNYPEISDRKYVKVANSLNSLHLR